MCIRDRSSTILMYTCFFFFVLVAFLFTPTFYTFSLILFSLFRLCDLLVYSQPSCFLPFYFSYLFLVLLLTTFLLFPFLLISPFSFSSVGVTIIKNAEMFVSPLTEIQLNGFMAIGNLKMQTEDGKTLGAVSICGSRVHIKEYIKAVDFLTANCDKLLGIKLQ
eukprot:TRINITY_DN10971_c0_g1_i2.p2 TRINITY_DN10971_c0_g1~~TRINITY_DN10971_c0_g1_i2.p2  ORF type:complete len:163 (+),score=10.15 TRINITY_DN10971_c0_g1_i2:135-623(+)